MHEREQPFHERDCFTSSARQFSRVAKRRTRKSQREGERQRKRESAVVVVIDSQHGCNVRRVPRATTYIYVYIYIYIYTLVLLPTLFNAESTWRTVDSLYFSGEDGVKRGHRTRRSSTVYPSALFTYIRFNPGTVLSRKVDRAHGPLARKSPVASPLEKSRALKRVFERINFPLLSS